MIYCHRGLRAIHAALFRVSGMLLTILSTLIAVPAADPGADHRGLRIILSHLRDAQGLVQLDVAGFYICYITQFIAVAGAGRAYIYCT